jgi:hypothetical protein
MRTRQGLLGVVALLLVVGCGRKKDWDEEIIVQVFKPKATNVGTVTVTATQGSKTDKATVDGFGDCDANRVRLIPKQGSSDDLTIRVTTSASLPLTCPAGVSSCGTDCCKLKPPGSSPLKLVLGTEKELEPSGTCTPTVQPPTPDGGTPKDPAGSPCSADTSCQGGKCLKEVQNTGTPITFPQGYCSQDCSQTSGTSCDSGEQCLDSTDGNNNVIGQYCVVKCVTSGGNCMRTGYECTPLDLCMPK